MATLSPCQPPPPPGWLTAAESECVFVAMREEERELRPQADWLCDIMVMFVTHPPQGEEAAQSAFLPVEEHWVKKTFVTWRDCGVVSALETLARDNSEEGNYLGKIASCFLLVARRMSTLLGQPGRLLQGEVEEICAAFSPTRDWGESVVRAISLHPRLPYIAIARKDDIIELRELSSHPGVPTVSLRDKDQRNITCMEWAPHCNHLLAVGSSSGVLLWNSDPTSATNRLLTSWVRVESSPGHAPVSSLSWSPLGNYLVSASPADASLIVWDIPMGVATRVRRAKGGGLALVLWSPNGQRVLAASTSAVFRVWETQQWTCEKWTHFDGRCRAACWSPNGDTLLFILEGDPAIYYLGFHGNETSAGSLTAIQCADLSPCMCTHPVTGEETLVGGRVRDIVWDPSGERLAITFTGDSPSASLVAVLRTRIHPTLEILPGGFVRGKENEVPLLVSFQRGCSEGATLAVVWSSGRVSFTPLLFQSPTTLPAVHATNLTTPNNAPFLYSTT